MDMQSIEKTPREKAGNYSDALFYGYDGERNRCLPEIGTEYNTRGDGCSFVPTETKAG